MLIVNELIGFGAPIARVPVDITYLGQLHTTTDATSHTQSGQSLGVEAADRVIIVVTCVVVAGTGHTVTGVTVAGQACAKIAEVSTGSNSSHTAIWAVSLPTGATGDIVASLSTTSTRFGMGFFRMTGTGGLTSALDTQTSTGTSLSTTTTVAANGGIVMISSCFTAALGTPTNITSRYNAIVDNLELDFGSDNISSGTSIASTATAGDVRATMVAASFASAG